MRGSRWSKAIGLAACGLDDLVHDCQWVSKSERTGFWRIQRLLKMFVTRGTLACMLQVQRSVVRTYYNDDVPCSLTPSVVGEEVTVHPTPGEGRCDDAGTCCWKKPAPVQPRPLPNV
jgi:hypothetical protein